MARLFLNAQLSDGRKTDLAVRDGRFVALETIDEACETIDLDGMLVLPGFVDGHIHLDKSFIGDRWRPHVPASSVSARLAVEKQLLGEALPIAERADALIAQAHSFGTIAMRSHVDVDATTGLTNLHSVMQAREKWQGRVDIELVAFPQAGILTSPGTADLLDAAVREGAQVVGGIDPQTLDGDAERHLDVVFGIAERRGVKIDIHLHEPGIIGIRQLERIATRTAAAGMTGQVTVSHAYALGEVPSDDVERIGAKLANAGVAIFTNAPGHHAFPPIAQLRAAGVRVFTGNDNIRDAWWPYGDGDMLQRAMLIGYRSGFYTDDELHVALNMASTEAAQALNLKHYGIHIGHDATFVVLDAPNAAAAVAAPPRARLLVQHGEFVQLRTPSPLAKLR